MYEWTRSGMAAKPDTVQVKSELAPEQIFVEHNIVISVSPFKINVC